MRLKHPGSKVAEDEMLTPIQQMAQSFHLPSAEATMPAAATLANPVPGVAQGEAAPPWGVAHFQIASSVSEMSLPKRLTMLVLACLRASGTIRVFVEVAPPRVEKQKEFYASLGFLPMLNLDPEASKEDFMYMSRSF